MTRSDLFAEVAIPVPVRQTFTYRIPAALDGRIVPGLPVNVPFGRRSAEGFVVSVGAAPAHLDPADIRDIRLAGAPEDVLPAGVLELTRWLADYYLCSWGEAIKAALPGGIEPLRATPRRRRKVAPDAGPADPQVDRRASDGESDAFQSANGDRSPLARPLTADQQQALAAIAPFLAEPAHRVFLLFGVTGSGKTEVYLEAAARVLARGGQVLAMVPEIALAPQMLAAFKSRFGDAVVLWHSALPTGQRRQAWRRVASGAATVVVGARSAVFAPFRNLGLIVVDEEHEPAYKQDEAPRYHGRDVAVVRAHRLGIPIVLGSATPSLESFQNAGSGKYFRLDMPRRIDDRPVPVVRVVPLLRKGDPRPEDDLPEGAREESAPDDRRGTGILSAPLVRALRDRMKRAEQAILFLNRRGHSTVVRCDDCGWVARCPHCDIALTWHADRKELRCHYCSHRSRDIDTCPDCAGR
ncbi:MAG TPA: primosomal protein N', partial [Candidatus Eisenbacteria bacterium]